MAINPFVLGAIRERQMKEELRRRMIRMDLAGNTSFLNPQLYSAYLEGTLPPDLFPLPVTMPAAALAAIPATPQVIAAGGMPAYYSDPAQYAAAAQQYLALERAAKEQAAIQMQQDEMLAQQAAEATRTAAEAAKRAIGENPNAADLINMLYPEQAAVENN